MYCTGVRPIAEDCEQGTGCKDKVARSYHCHRNRVPVLRQLICLSSPGPPASHRGPNHARGLTLPATVRLQERIPTSNAVPSQMSARRLVFRQSSQLFGRAVHSRGKRKRGSNSWQHAPVPQEADQCRRRPDPTSAYTNTPRGQQLRPLIFGDRGTRVRHARTTIQIPSDSMDVLQH